MLALKHIGSLSYQQFYQILTSYTGLTYHSIAIFYQKEFHKAVKLWQQDRTLSQDMIDISRLNRFITTTTWGVCSLESNEYLNFRLGIQPKVQTLITGQKWQLKSFLDILPKLSRKRTKIENFSFLKSFLLFQKIVESFFK